MRPAGRRRGRPVLVAVDSGPASCDAVAWAAAEASARRTGLVVLHVAAWPVPGWDPFLVLHPAAGYAWIDDPDQRALQEAVEVARRVAPEVAIGARFRAGVPARGIAREGRRAALVVLGRQPHPTGRRPVIESVLAARPACPVVLAGSGGPARPAPSAGQVVVAVDDDHRASAASVLLRHAVDAAWRRGVGVTMVSTVPHASIMVRPEPHYPAVDVRWLPRAGAAEEQLLRESRSAALLVLDASRASGRRPFGAGLGEPGHSSPPPVMLVPTRSRDRLGGWAARSAFATRSARL